MLVDREKARRYTDSSITLGVTLVSPQLMNAYLIGKQAPEVWDFGLFVIEKVGYQAQVIPAMLAGMALAFIETHLKRIIHLIYTLWSCRLFLSLPR